MTYLNETEYIESYEFFLVDEAFNARQMYIDMIEVMGIDTLNEAEIIALNEATLDNIKNFVITIGKRIAEAIGRFIDRVDQLTGISRRWLNENQAAIRQAGEISGSTFNNLYEYTNIDQVVNTNIADTCTNDELEANKDKWQDEESYLTNRGTKIAGFTYNPAAGDSFQDQLQKFFRGRKMENVPSNWLKADIRTDYLEYCLATFPAAKTTINAEKDTLKQSANNLETYIANKRSQQKNAPQPTDVTGTETTTTTQQTVASGVTASSSPNINATGTPANASFEFETQDSFFNEVEIKNNNDGSPKEQNTAGQNTNTTTKVDTKVDPAKKNKEEIAQASKAIRTYYKVNSKKLSAKMNICIEAYRSRFKLLKWYVNASKKKSTDNKPADNTPQNTQPNNNTSMAAAFGQ